ncbi:unnamed protein product [Pylaiella littoralis]
MTCSCMTSGTRLLLSCLGFLVLFPPGDAEAVQTDIRRTTSTAFAHQTPFQDTTTAYPQHTTKAPSCEVEVKPDLEATKFSPHNAFYFATLSKIAYKPFKEAMGLVKGNSTCEGLGFDRFYWFEAGEDARKSSFDAIHDTEAFVAANDDMIVVVFRGTKEFPDWVANLKAWARSCSKAWGFPDPTGGVHEGFNEGVDTVWQSHGGMQKVIKDLYNEQHKDRKLYIAGHSLGAALATITAARLAFEDDMKITAIYTMGSPRVFDNAAAANFDQTMNFGILMKEKYFRCRNNNDIVTRVPPTYKHVGTEIYLDRWGVINTASILDQVLGRLISLARRELIDGVHDHATSEYIRLFRQVVINSRVPLLDKAVTAVGETLGDLFLQVAPDGVAEKQGNVRRLKNIRSTVEKAKTLALETSEKENAMEF